MKLITVFTTTYNRKVLLGRVYESLCNQTDSDFKWLIVDDGSNDNTKNVVFDWISQNKLDIEYIYKSNGGVHTARNVAYNSITTELCLQVDSDDWLLKDTIKRVREIWNLYGNKNYAGIVGLCINKNNEIIGSELPKLTSVPFRHLNTKYKVRGDKFYVFRNEIMTSIPNYPIFKNENRVPIAWKYYQIPDEKEMLIVNEPMCVVEYQVDGISSRIREQYFKNPKGMAEGYKIVLKYSYGIKQLIKSSIGYVVFSLIAKEKNIIRKSPKRIMTLIFYPLGILGYIYIYIKWGKYHNR